MRNLFSQNTDSQKQNLPDKGIHNKNFHINQIKIKYGCQIYITGLFVEFTEK